MGISHAKMTFDDILEAYSSNRSTYEELISYGRTRIIPMIGAGVSRAIGYPSWSELLLRIVDDEDSCKDSVKSLVEAGMYEDAANCITQAIGKNTYRRKIRRIFDISNSLSKPWPTFLQDLPHLFRGPIATLNYDKIIENAFSRENVPVPSVYVPMDTYETAAIYDAVQSNGSAIIKVHGTIDNPDSIVLSKDEYDRAYGENLNDINKPMPKILQSAAYGRAFLFLGCSLNQDRFMSVFCNLLGGSHYAYLELPDDDEKIRTKKVLLDKCHIYPLWYPNGCDKTEALNILITQLKKELLQPEDVQRTISHTTNRLINKEEPFLFRSDTADFIGREVQFRELKDFLYKSSIYNGIWWAVVGPGGAGKSRLAYELELFAESSWNVKWISNNTPFNYQYFDCALIEDYRHLLLIVDVDYSGITELGKWLADINTRKYKNKVRVLILSRDGNEPDSSNIGPQWRSMLNDFNCIPEMENFLYKNEYLELDTLSEMDMTAIVRSYLHNMYPQIEYSEDDIKRIYKRLVDLGVTNRPIYALFVAESFAHNEDVFAWNAEEILDYILNREIISLRKKTENAFQTTYANNPDLFLSIETLYAKSIMSGKSDIEGDTKLGLHNIVEKSGLSKERVLSRLENYGLTTNAKISEIKPDIIGEYFVLRYYDHIDTIYDNWDFFKRFFKDLAFILLDQRKELLDTMFSDHPYFLDHFGAGLYEIVRNCDVSHDTAFRAASCLYNFAVNTGSLRGMWFVHPYFTYCLREGLIEFVEHLSVSEANDVLLNYRNLYAKNPGDATIAEIYVRAAMIFGDNYSMYFQCILDDLHNIYLNFPDDYGICAIVVSWIEYMLKYKQTPFDEVEINKVLNGEKRKTPIFK